MELLLRYIIQIIAGSLATIIGGLLAYGGAKTAFVVLYLLSDDGRAAVALSNGKYDANLLITPAINATLMLIPGIVLLIWGVRSVVSRLMAGMPSENEGRATTTAGRWGSSAVFTFGILLASHGLVLGIIDLVRLSDFTMNGQRVEATVSKNWQTKSSETGKTIIMVRFRYPLSDGSIFNKEMQIPVHLNYAFSQDKKVEIVYKPSAPDQILLMSEFPGTFSYLWYFLWRLAFIFIGIRGIQRNFPVTPGPKAPSTQPRPPAPNTRKIARQAPRATGNQFGRRGT